jgi:hypothetical protein
MSTAGIQNYLSNVFRPIYTYDTTATTFTPKLELVNLDTVSANVVSVFSAAIGDSASNVYVGSNAGNPYTTLRACSNVTALGYGAGSNISNTSNSVFVGWYAGANESNSSNVIAIGKGSGGTDGTDNICIGTDTGVRTGSRNTLLGHFMDLSGTSDQLRIGYSNRIPIAADVSRNWVGIGGILNPTNIAFATFDVSGSTRLQGNVGININPGDRTLDVNGNFRADHGVNGVLDFDDGITTSTGGFGCLRGTFNAGIGSLTPIGTLKKGVITVSAQDNVSASHYESTIVYCPNAGDGSSCVAMSSNVQLGNVTIEFEAGGSNIQISNANSVRAIGWSITYYPVP